MSPISRIFRTHHVAQLAGNVKEPTHLSKKVWCCGLALSHMLVLLIGYTSLHISSLDRIVEEKLL